MADRRAEIEARLAAATPGPWEITGGGEYVSGPGIIVAPDDGGVTDADANLIAHAPDDLRWLLDALAAAEAWRDALAAEVELLRIAHGAAHLRPLADRLGAAAEMMSENENRSDEEDA